MLLFFNIINLLRKNYTVLFALQKSMIYNILLRKSLKKRNYFYFQI